ncbi:MAG: bile acid:sodium symporter [Puniceicoccaceae bacterium]
MMQWLRQQSLTLSLLAAVILSALTPDWGARGGHLRSEILIWAGVVVIFLSQGFLLSRTALLRGLASWHLHLFSQGWMFLGMPLLAMLGLALAGDTLAPEIRLGVFYLSILPTTIASAIALIAHAKGNIGAAIFNTVFANLFAVLVVPFWLVATQFTEVNHALPLGSTLRQLTLMVLLPFACGQLIRIWFHPFESTVARLARPLQQSIIVFMVYAAFATSFQEQVWEKVGTWIALQALFAAILLLFVASALILLSIRVLCSNPTDRIALFFLSSQKSLAVGVPFAIACFSSISDDPTASAQLSIILLPLLFYHPLQLMFAGIILKYKTHLFGKIDILP